MSRSPRLRFGRRSIGGEAGGAAWLIHPVPNLMALLTIAFDLDGTLIDTAPDLISTLNLIFSKIDVSPVSYQEARRLVGGGVRPLIERGLAAKGLSVVPTRVDEIYAQFLEHYSRHIADASRPFPGVFAALDRLITEGATLAVCTNKLEWLSIKLLDEVGLSSRFSAVCGQDTFGIAKPDPEILRKTIRRAGGDMARAIMVGDSRTDIDLARAAGVPVIAVDFGYTDVHVRELGPDRVIGHFDELADTIDHLVAVQQ